MCNSVLDLKKMKEFDLWRPGFLTQENLSEALLEVGAGHVSGRSSI